MMSFLPPTEDGYLPSFVFLVSTIAFANVIQCYTTLSYTQRVYSRTPVTPLSARTFGTWNLAVAIVRLYASYHMNEASWYQMSIWTNVVGLFHFGLECFVYKTGKFFSPMISPYIVATTGLIWHLIQYNNYVR